MKSITFFLSSLVIILSLSGCSEAITNKAEESSKQTIVAQAELISLQSATVGPPSIPRMWNYKIQFMTPENRLKKKFPKVEKIIVLYVLQNFIRMIGKSGQGG